jgi:lipopolysaccharide export system permease protein
MKIFDLYVFRNLALATVFVSVILAVVIFLTQSLRFLELVIDSGASSTSFWILTFLALPRFFEIIMPLSLMAATIFIYNRMTMDSELIAIRSVGYSPMSLARPALTLSVIVTVFLWAMTMWIAPKSLSNMHHMRQVIKASFSSLLFREGVFNQVGTGLTVYMRERTAEGDLRGLMIHDTRNKQQNPSTILAQHGKIVFNDDGHQAVVYDGSRQEYDPKTGTLNRLNFERYTIDLPESEPVRLRWREPEERTILELLRPNLSNQRDADSRREFAVEIHRRIVSPLLAMVFTVISCCALLLGPIERRGQGRRIIAAIGSVVVLQSLFLAASSLSRQTDWGLLLMYLIALVPLLAMLFLLSTAGEQLRRRFLYSQGGRTV